jgi:hypothetical protein
MRIKFAVTNAGDMVRDGDVVGFRTGPFPRLRLAFGIVEEIHIRSITVYALIRAFRKRDGALCSRRRRIDFARVDCVDPVTAMASIR